MSFITKENSYQIPIIKQEIIDISWRLLSCYPSDLQQRLNNNQITIMKFMSDKQENDKSICSTKVGETGQAKHLSAPCVLCRIVWQSDFHNLQEYSNIF
jgi:hypothetical protein